MSHSISYDLTPAQNKAQSGSINTPSCSYRKEPFARKQGSKEKRLEKYWWDRKFVRLDFSFKPHFSESKRVLQSKERGFFVEALNFWGLVDWNSSLFHQPILTDAGKAAFFDIRCALIFQEIILNELDRKSYSINYNVYHCLNTDTMNKEEVSKEMNKLLREKKEIDLIKKEVKESVNYTVLHLIFMELNSNTTDRIFSDSDEIRKETKGGKEWFFSTSQECDPIEEGIEATESMTPSDETPIGTDELFKKNIQSASLKADILDRIAMHVTLDFEQLVLKYQPKKSRLFFWKPRGSNINPRYPSHREIHAFATQIGALLYDCTNLCSSLYFEFRKRLFLQKRGAAAQHISRTLQFLIQGVLAPQETRLGSFSMEKKGIQDVLIKSSDTFQERLALLKEEQRSSFKCFLDMEVNKILKQENEIQCNKE